MKAKVMAMSLQQEARDNLATAMAELPECCKTIASAGKTATGVCGTRSSTAALMNDGDRGRKVQTIRLDASKLDRPEDGATIKIDGEDSQVLVTRIDPTGAILAIEYLIGRPTTSGGVGL